MNKISEVISNYWEWYRTRNCSSRIAISSIFGGFVLIVVGLVFHAVVPVAAQSSPSQSPPSITGNCNAFGNNNTNCSNNTYITPKQEPRHLNPTESHNIYSNMKGKTFPILIIGVGGEESQVFAKEIRSALKDPARDVSGGSVSSANPPFYGLQILRSSPAGNRETLHDALMASGLSAPIIDGYLPVPGEYVRKDATVLIVGLHPELK
jgi:hypothetical protein